MSDQEQTAAKQLDLAGAVTVTAGLVLLVYILVEAPEAGWVATLTVLSFGGAIALLALFVFLESRSPAPLVPLTIAATARVCNDEQ